MKNKESSENEDEFEGIISQKNDIAKSIVVEGKAIFADSDTEITISDTISAFSDLIVGQKVNVETIFTGGKLVASKIKVENQDSEDENDTEEVKGTITKINHPDSTIIVDGLVISVTDNTKIDINDTAGSLSDFAVGNDVKVETVFLNGQLEATEIKVENQDSEDD